MPSTYSTNLRLELIADGEQSGTWGQTTNRNLGTLLEAAISSVQSIALTGTTHTLTANNGVTDESRSAALLFTGTLSADNTVTAPSVTKLYVLKNATTGGFNVLFKTAGGTALTIHANETVLVYCDGVNIGLVGVPITSPAFAGTPTAPTAAPGTNTTQISTTAFVAAAITAATGSLGTMSTQNANNVAVTGGAISGVTLSTTASGNSVNGNVVGTNATGAKTISAGTPSGGASGDVWYQV